MENKDNKKNNSVHFEGIGLINVIKNPKAKRISIVVKPIGEVRVTVPRGINFAEAKKFIFEKKEWINKALEKNSELRKKNVFDETSTYSTKFHKLRITKHNTDKIKGRISNGIIDVFYPNQLPITHPQIQEFIKKSIIFTLKKEALAFLPKRIEELAKKYNFEFRKISVRDTKTRWGSCSSENNISLSIHLMRLPEHLIDYVLIHELCHIKEKNHGPNFWKLLDKYTGDAKKLALEMKNYHTTLL